MASGSTWKGLAEFQRRIDALPDHVRTAARQALEKSTDEAVSLIQRNVATHPDAPHIRDTVRAEPGRSDLSIDVVMGSEEAPYAAPLEFGHMAPDGSHVPAQPVFYPAVKVVRKRHRSRIAREVRKALKDGPK
ncbi:HK97 gp10 family phage protein [Brevundimonas sp. 2R-24]|uniref:HK97 gp10 family phage protein n=1 Tax=Peiella sedimenti TaxID=3061083 RepID=A0ABT8SQ60_9CAUL|nr:HK97 gp10 family phage protein [Caulobacteraceae bacterium XZ-24]